MVSSVETHHSQIMKGVLDMCLLASISREPNYGYALMTRLTERGLPAGSEGSIYLVLKRMLKHGLIAAELVPSESGPARKVYHSTAAGRTVLEAWVADWRQVRDGVDSILDRE